MKKYRYDNLKVIENKSKYIIQICKTKEEAKKIAGQLNGGTAFAGETPHFFIYAKDQK